MQDSKKDVPSKDEFLLDYIELVKRLITARIATGFYSENGNEKKELMKKMKE